jgi:DNA-directed RNA polymerase specialized sigma24 family protein
MTTVNDELLARLATIESLLTSLIQQRTIKDWYSTAEVADLLGRAEFTVREWCRLGRVHAEKRKAGRGPASEWIISHAELCRVRNEGLLPNPQLSPRPV